MRHVLLALVVALAVTIVQVAFPPRPTPVLPEIDAKVYVSIAHQLATDGVFGDGDERRSMFFSPLYPAFLATIMQVDEGFARMSGCVRRSLPDCRPDTMGAVAVQTVVAALSAVLVWVAARALTGSSACAWLSMLLVLATAHYATFARQFLTENLVFPLFTAATLALALGVRDGWRRWWLAAGLLLGGLALVRPVFSYLVYAALALALALVLVPATRRLAARAFGLLLLGYAIVVLPWMLRNWMQFDTFALTKGYDGFILVQRLQYNDMSLREWLVSFLYWQPDFGAPLASRFLVPADWERLSWDAPSSFYMAGEAAFQRAIAGAGGLEQTGSYLIRTQLLPDLGWHLLVTVSLALRGVWVMKLWGLVCVPIGLWMLAVSARRRDWMLLTYLLPGWFMLGLHAAVSVNVTRYNLIMMPALALGAALSVLAVWRRVRAGDAKHPA